MRTALVEDELAGTLSIAIRPITARLRIDHDGLDVVGSGRQTWFIAYVDGWTDDMFFVDVDDGEAFDLSRSIMLAQIVHHATEHRSQIRTTLSAHGIEPPELSVWAWRKSDEGRAILAELSGQR